MSNSMTITKADGTKENFEEYKLTDSLKRAGGSADIARNIVGHIKGDLQDGMPTSQIYERAFCLLREYSIPIAVKYSLRRALSELGPDGFPFEKYVSRIFNAWGYKTLTDQTVSGLCVSHEVDVVAWKRDKLAMAEVKFHNEFWLKSDLKVILYVKARFDDLRQSSFNYGGIAQKLDEGWIITNTKFTDQAIKYGECQNIKMMGWNYSRGNLHDVIEELHLHPFTCLISLSNVHKKYLLRKGVVLCSDILNHQGYLKEIGMNTEDIPKVIEEANIVCGS